jgi:hypothetical protein
MAQIAPDQFILIGQRVRVRMEPAEGTQGLMLRVEQGPIRRRRPLGHGARLERRPGGLGPEPAGRTGDAAHHHGPPRAEAMLLRRLLLSLSLGACLLVPAQAAELTLRYAQPAPDTPEGWEQQALPIGNGRLGAMLFGNLARERLPFNDITLWRGDRQQMGAYQPFGDVRLTLQGHAAAPTHYERRLQLKPGRFELDYTVDGVRFHRQAFASFPAQVIVLRLTGRRAGGATAAGCS